MDGVDPVVVVTTMPLSPAARADLGELLGDGYVVIDIKSAPTSAELVLTTVVSAQSIGVLRAMFPEARILLTEIHDAERGIRFPGPLSRAMDTGPDGYFVAHGLEALSPIVQSQARLQLGGREAPVHGVTDVLESSTGTTPHVLELVAPDLGEEHEGVVTWISSSDGHLPPGELLDLSPLDDAVTAILQTAQPRESPLWGALVAECAIHLVRHGRATVLVDIRNVPDRTLAELQVLVAVDGTRSVPWPRPASGTG